MEINPQNKKTLKDNIQELLQLWKEFKSNDETKARQLLKEILEEIQTQSIIPQFEKGQSQIFITILSKYYDCQKWLEFDKLNQYKGLKDSSPKLQNKLNELQNKTLNTSLGQNIINTNNNNNNNNILMNQNTNNGFNNTSQTPKSPTNILDYQSNRRSSNPLNSTNNNNIEHNVYKNNSNIDIISNNNASQNQVQQEIESNGKSDNDNNKNININNDEINQAMINSNSTGKQKGQDQQLEVFLSNFVNEIKKEIKEEGKQQKNDLEGKIEKFLAQIQKREEQLQKELDNLKQNQVINNINQNSNNTNNNQNSSGNTRLSHNLNLNNNLGHSISPKQNYFSAHQNHQYQYLNDDSQYALQKPVNGQDYNMTKIKLMQSQDQQDNIQELNNQRPINYIPRISNSPYQQNVMFFEMHLDYTSFFDYFDIFNAEMEQKMSDLQEFEEFDQQIDEWTKGEQKLQQYQIQQLLNKHQNRVQKQEYYVETLIIKKEEELRNFISQILKHIEVFFKNQNIGVLFNTLVEDKNHKLVKINIFDNFQKARIGFVKENWASQNFDIILKNYHYTYEIGDDEVFLYQENSLYGENLEIVSHHQYLIDDKDNIGYKSPITISLLGVFNKPLGIKVTLYNTENLQENGLFLTVDEYQWVRDIVLEQYNKKKKKANKQEIKEQWGYEIIQKGFNCSNNDKGTLDFTINRNTIENNYIDYQNQKPKQSIIRAEDFLQNEIFLNIILGDLNEKFQQSK
ncbi:hypothetical protein PPERSA_10295 [Pseudocohnilembus persalinus]|uniref:Uncharacterized protein n=1 Tax=Pseudocohnilembus persalinus TaxID=266149 RepID=A0A0V0R070_PSEPJ|nr:hypothetical protein PPERSA_10295 [Pseudocohnilembus persalinus]|eukprot:KRX07907.1 hypothetical protein PPERSA_10295 [Pseudocohnilembus persalinus]